MAYANWKAEKFTREEEAVLVKQMLDGDIEARNRLLQSQAGVIHAIATQYARRSPALSRKGTADLVNTAVVQILRKCHLFDPSRGFRFSTWVAAVARSVIGKILTYELQRHQAINTDIPDTIPDDAIDGRLQVDDDDNWQRVAAWLERQPDSVGKRIVMERLSGKTLLQLRMEMKMSSESARTRWLDLVARARNELFPELNDD